VFDTKISPALASAVWDPAGARRVGCRRRAVGGDRIRKRARLWRNGWWDGRALTGDDPHDGHRRIDRSAW